MSRKALDQIPRFLVTSATTTAADTNQQVTVQFPIGRLIGGGNSQQLVELLWVELYHGTTFNAHDDCVGIGISTQDTAFNCLGPADYMKTAGALCAFTNTMCLLTSGAVMKQQPMIYDWSLEGRGRLVATENLYINFDTAGAGATQDWTVFLYYRVVKATLQDYLALLQSQQNV